MTQQALIGSDNSGLIEDGANNRRAHKSLSGNDIWRRIFAVNMKGKDVVNLSDMDDPSSYVESVKMDNFAETNLGNSGSFGLSTDPSEETVLNQISQTILSTVHDQEKDLLLLEKNYPTEFQSSDCVNLLNSLGWTGTVKEQERITYVMTEIYEHYLQNCNIGLKRQLLWNQCLSELGRVIELSKRRKLSRQEAHNALLAFLFSHRAKIKPYIKDQGTFFSRNMDGARASSRILFKYVSDERTAQFDDLIVADLNHIEHAILEHQMCPPAFKATEYTWQIIDGLNTERKLTLKRLKNLQVWKIDLSEIERQEISQLSQQKKEFERKSLMLALLRSCSELTDENKCEIECLQFELKFGCFATDIDILAINNIEQGLADPNGPFPKENDPVIGGKRLKFSEYERELLRKYVGEGTENCWVPDSENSWHKVSQLLNDAETLDKDLCNLENKLELSQRRQKSAA